MSEEIFYAEATDLARLIRAKEISPVEVLKVHLERIKAVNPKINAVVTLVDGALEEARSAENAVTRGDTLGSLHGVPFTVKDCVDTNGVRTTRGSRLFQNYVPTSDATVVTRLKAAGGVLMAKTNMPEFALWWETDNTIFGRTKNPWDLELTAGGSSGGEAAAIAAGLSPLGVGSDVGGSIRLPAHYCGIVGLKATHGRIPLTGHWPETLLRFMHVGPMARTVRDVALGLSVMAGFDPADPYTLPLPLPDFLGLDPPISGVRVGWTAGRVFGPVEPEVSDAVAVAAAMLAGSGYHVEEVSFPALEGRDAQAMSATIFGVEAGTYLEPIVAGHKEELSFNIQRRLGLPTPSFREYLEYREECEALRRDVAAYFSQYDLLLCPSAPLTAHRHDVTELDIAGETVTARNALRATLPWDLTGSPAISVPFILSSKGMPIGIQIVGRHFHEATVLRAAAVLEDNRHPPG